MWFLNIRACALPLLRALASTRPIPIQMLSSVFQRPCLPATGRPQRYVCRAAATETPSSSATKQIFVAMNVFKVKAEHTDDFENVWKTRESHLKEMPGFVRFALLKCSNVENKYISQTTWESEEAFRNWTQSQQFSKSHGERNTSSDKRPSVGAMLDGPPSPEFFHSVTVTE